MKAVDLGLSVFWGEAPLEMPNEYYDERLFTWGDDSYNFSNNRGHEDVDFDELVTNGIISDDGFLTPHYDHASQILGEKWRMPTVEEIEELIKRCEWTWIGDGYTVIGPNKNSIKIPYVVSYHDTGRAIIIEDTWGSEYKQPIMSKKIDCFWSSEPSYDNIIDGLLYEAYALRVSHPESDFGISVSSEKRNEKNQIIPVTTDKSFVKDKDSIHINKPQVKRPSFVNMGDLGGEKESYVDIVPPPIVPNGERFPLPFWNKLSEKAKEFLNKQWGVSCENEYNKLLNDMGEVIILEHALKNNGLI